MLGSYSACGDQATANGLPMRVPSERKRAPHRSLSLPKKSMVHTTTKLPVASIATVGLYSLLRVAVMVISLPILWPVESKSWALMSLSLDVLWSVQTTTARPLGELATAGWFCTWSRVVLTRTSVPESERRVRSSSASHSSRRTGEGCAPVLVPLRAQRPKVWPRNENMVGDLHATVRGVGRLFRRWSNTQAGEECRGVIET